MELPVLDFDRLLTQTGGDLELAHETLSKFRKVLRTHYQVLLRDAWERKDGPRLRHLSHGISTPATHLGAQRIAAAAVALEQCLVQQKDLALTPYEALIQAIDEFLVDAR